MAGIPVVQTQARIFMWMENTVKLRRLMLGFQSRQWNHNILMDLIRSGNVESQLLKPGDHLLAGMTVAIVAH